MVHQEMEVQQEVIEVAIADIIVNLVQMMDTVGQTDQMQNVMLYGVEVQDIV